MNKKQSVPEIEKPVEYSMRMVASHTGLTPDVIRVWEKRYAAVSPRRTATGRRVYSAAEFERLKLLSRLTLQGHAISGIAGLSLEQLRELAAPSRENAPLSTVSAEDADAQRAFFARSHVSQCVTAVEQLDAELLENVLSRSLVHFGPTGTIELVLQPVLEHIDQLWENGSLRIAEEHVASSVLRTFLTSLMRHALLPPDAPVLAVTTPSNQMHELGALMVAATAAHQGWKVLYLGADLPAAEIAAAAQRSQAQVVALSIVYPAGDARLVDELKELRRRLPQTKIFIGGRAVDSYYEALGPVRAIWLTDLQSLRRELANAKAPFPDTASPTVTLG